VGEYLHCQTEKRRTSFYDMKRMEWSIHVEELLAERGDTFSQFFLMEHDSFTTLCDIINSDVQKSKNF